MMCPDQEGHRRRLREHDAALLWYCAAADLDQNLVFRSIDVGESWSDPQPTFNYVDEPHIIQLHSGEVLGAFRLQRAALEDDPAELVEKWSRRARARRQSNAQEPPHAE